MENGKKIENVVEIHLTLETFEDGSVQVYMRTRGANFSQLAYATKYMMWITAKNSHAEVDEVLEDLCDGARNFKGVSLSLVPRVPKRKD